METMEFGSLVHCSKIRMVPVNTETMVLSSKILVKKLVTPESVVQLLVIGDELRKKKPHKMKIKSKKRPSSNTKFRSKASVKKLTTKKKPSKSTGLNSPQKGYLAARKDAWLEYLAITPSMLLPSDPKIFFICGWEAGVEWAMQTINGPNYKG